VGAVGEKADVGEKAAVVEKEGEVVADFLAAPPPVDQDDARTGADAESSLPADASVALTLAPPASSSDGAGASVGGTESVANKKTKAPKTTKAKESESAAPVDGVGGVGGGVESQDPPDVVSSIEEVAGTFGSIDASLTPPVSSSIPTKRSKQKSPFRQLIVTPLDSSSTSPVLGPSDSAPVSPKKRASTGGKGPAIAAKRPHTGGKSASVMAQVFGSLRTHDTDDEDEVEGDEEQPCSSTTDATSTIKKKSKATTEKTHVSKRHGKVKKPSIEGICKNEIKRIARRAGIMRLGGGVYEELRLEAQDYLDDLLFKSLVHTDYRQAKTVTPQDVVAGFKTIGGGSYYGEGPC
jgi:histone H4